MEGRDVEKMLSDYRLSDGAKVLMLIIALQPDGTISRAKLVEVSNKSRASVHRYCKELRALDHIVVKELGCKGTTYTIKRETRAIVEELVVL